MNDEAIDRLRAINAQLLEALEAAKYSLDCLMRETGGHFTVDVIASEMARAAIDAAKEQR